MFHYNFLFHSVCYESHDTRGTIFSNNQINKNIIVIEGPCIETTKTSVQVNLDFDDRLQLVGSLW